jgi:hypothetical protein
MCTNAYVGVVLIFEGNIIVHPQSNLLLYTFLEFKGEAQPISIAIRTEIRLRTFTPSSIYHPK